MKKLLFLFFLVSIINSCKKDTVPFILPTATSLYRAHGLDVSWDQSGSERIAFSTKGVDGYYDIHFAKPDGTNEVCLNCNQPALPAKHIACPYWHPSGKWLLITAEKSVHPGSSTDALPGFGAYTDIWIISSDAQKAYKLVDILNDYDHGVIAPRFSHNGKQIVWTDRKSQPNMFNSLESAGFWTIKIADFKFGATDSIPVVSNIRTIEPGGSAFYESYGFSPDDSRIIFCSDMHQASFWDEHIYTIDTLGNNIMRLTASDYNEHAFYKPDGSKIIWMSNAKSTKGGTDWWMMNPDGSGKERLTYFNEPDNPQFAGQAVWAGLGSFQKQGQFFVGGRQTSLVTQEGEIMMVKILH